MGDQCIFSDFQVEKTKHSLCPQYKIRITNMVNPDLQYKQNNL